MTTIIARRSAEARSAPDRRTIEGISALLAAGRTSARALVEDALGRADNPEGEGGRVFTRLYREQAFAAAEASDQQRRAGIEQGPLAGIPVTIKDLFDVAGEPTLAGSVLREAMVPAAHDAVIVQRLRAAGAIVLGRTNMTEFAFSGLGLNPHYGTPASPWERAARRIPGGSSSGAGVSVADGMTVAAIGTDTGGSVRIPAAFNGVVGWKPTARRIPLEGCLPLSPSLDSIGPLAHSVACCALVDAVMAGEAPAARQSREAAGLRLAVPRRYLLDDLDAAVASAFERALTKLAQAGARIVDIPFAELEEIPGIMARGALVTVEAFAVHRERLGRWERLYDPRVSARIKLGGSVSAADYIAVLRARADLIARAAQVTAGFDAILCPTVPIVAPPIAPLEQDDDLYVKTNLRVLRNTTAFNVLDRCAISLPMHAPGEPPSGLMVVGETMGDRALLSAAAAVEAALSH
jgi:aspartyl-tRNA(Asn)/glutamyl-tRNA(Gln) amidotransferase subunit A